MDNIKELNFFLVLCKTKKKLDKYIKLNRIKKKYIIDIKKLMDEFELNSQNVGQSDLFKIYILKKFNMAKEKKLDIYYVPNLNTTKKYTQFFSIKELLKDSYNFNLLYFYEEFDKLQHPQEILENISEFDFTQIIENY